MTHPPIWAHSVADAVRYFNLRSSQPRKLFTSGAEPVARRVARLQALWHKSRAKTQTAVDDAAHMLENIINDDDSIGVPNRATQAALLELGAKLAIDNHLFFSLPTIGTRSLTAPEADFLERRLIEIQTRLENEEHLWSKFGEYLARIYLHLLGGVLPPSAFKEASSQLSVPLYVSVGGARDFACFACVLFLRDFLPQEPDAIAELAMRQTRNQFWSNILDASHLTYEQAEKTPQRVIGPQDSDLPPEQLIHAYLHDTPLLDLALTPMAFEIPDEVRPEHILMVASTGSGKTQFIQADILGNLMRPNGPGMVVIDSQNQMIPKLERLQVARDRIVIVDPFDEEPPALNMFIAPERNYDPNLKEAIETATLEQFGWIFSALDQELSGRMNTLFTFSARVLLAMAPNVNMMSLVDLLRIDKLSRLKSSQFWPFIQTMDAPTLVFFEDRFCTNDFNKTKGGVADRLLGVMRVPAFNRMFMATQNRLDLYKELADRKLIVFNTQKRMLGEHASAIFGRYAISLYIRAALEREADRAPPLAFLYVDEASEYFGKKDSSDTLFTQLRKYNCGTFAAFQEMGQFGEQTHTLMTNTTTKLAARLSPTDAGNLAASMHTSAHELLSIGKRKDGFEMAAHIKDITPHAVKLTFPFGAVENAPRLTDAEHRQLRADNRKRFGSKTHEGPSKPEPSREKDWKPAEAGPKIVPPPRPPQSTDDDPSKAKPGPHTTK